MHQLNKQLNVFNQKSEYFFMFTELELVTCFILSLKLQKFFDSLFRLQNKISYNLSEENY